MKKIFTLIVMCFVAVATWAYDVKVGGIYYKLNTTDKNAEVTSGDSEYSGAVSIPGSIVSSGETYSVTSIGDYAFYFCMKLTSVTLTEPLQSIGSAAFYNCGLTSITIPNTVTIIKDNAFVQNEATSLTLGTSLETIEEEAFDGCDNIPSIAIPSSVKSIGDRAFAFMNAVTSITVDEGNTTYDSRDNCNAIIEKSSNTLIKGCQNSTIPGTVTAIGGSAFAGNSGLTSITIPSLVTTIGGEAFNGCGGLITVYNYATTPQTLNSNKDFSNHANCTLYVPQGCVETYQAATYWKDFKEIKEIEGTVVETVDAINAVSGPVEFYQINGAQSNGQQKGLNIIKTQDGVKKVMVK